MKISIDAALLGAWESNYSENGDRWGLEFFKGGTGRIINEICYDKFPFRLPNMPNSGTKRHFTDCLWSAKNGVLKINAPSINLEYKYEVSDSEIHLSYHKEPLKKINVTTLRSSKEESKMRENLIAKCIAKAIMVFSIHIECRLREVDKKLAYQGEVICHNGGAINPIPISFDRAPDSEMFKSYMAYILNYFSNENILPEYDDILKESVCNTMLNGKWELYFRHCIDGFMQSILVVCTMPFGEVSFPFDICEPDMAKFVADVRKRQV